jgi:TonB family protein
MRIRTLSAVAATACFLSPGAQIGARAQDDAGDRCAAMDTSQIDPNRITEPKPHARDVTTRDYPHRAALAGQFGTVTLNVIIGKTGRIEQASVLKSSGFPRLDHAAIGMAQEDWSYEPAKFDGCPIVFPWSVDVNWILPGAPPPQPRRRERREAFPRSIMSGGRLMGQGNADGVLGGNFVPGLAELSGDRPPAETSAGAIEDLSDEAATATQDVTPPRRRGSRIVSSLDYPRVSAAEGQKGSVILNLLVSADGRVADATILSSSGYPRLDRAAVGMAIEDWRYEPARKAGQPVESWVRARVDWVP